MNDENSRYQDPIDRISSSYREAQVLLTANRLGVFETLGEKRLSLDELTNALEADRRGVRILCDALVSLEILEKADGCYRNAPLAMEYLLPDSPSSKNALLLHSARLYERWGKLYDTVKSGIPAPKEAIDPNLIGDERAFAKAMADVGRKSAKELAGILDLSQVKTLLDLGGGPGLYAIEFAKQNPQLNAVVFDTKETLEVAKENAKDAGLSDRVSARAGDLFGDSFGEGYDFILVSNVIHIYSYENNKELVAKCAKALAPGGAFVR